MSKNKTNKTVIGNEMLVQPINRPVSFASLIRANAMLALLMVAPGQAGAYNDSDDDSCGVLHSGNAKSFFRDDDLSIRCYVPADGDWFDVLVKPWDITVVVNVLVGTANNIDFPDFSDVDPGDPITFPSVIGFINYGARDGDAGAVNVVVEGKGDKHKVVSDQNGVAGIRVSSLGGNGSSGSSFFGVPTSGGEPGKDGKQVKLKVDNIDIVTNKGKAHGVSVVSFGGPGGSGSSAFFGGSSGDAGGSGGTVNVRLTETTTIKTKGRYSYGIEAVSRGGTGGVGGDSTLGNGDEGGTGSESFGVRVSTQALIETGADQNGGVGSAGILAQSIGGGGGNGGDGGFFGGGDEGGSGADGGSVSIFNGAQGRITTNGKFASGVSAQSLGGGGGNGGNSTAPITLGVGSGGKGGQSSAVEVFNRGAIVTKGTISHGIFAQSIGGGGGQGGNSVGLVTLGSAGGAGNSGGPVKIVNSGSGSIKTNEAQSSAIFAQSIGGGGGDAGFAAGPIAFGGSGGSGGKADRVVIYNAGTLETLNIFSSGILAQSIGGGGGAGGDAGGILSLGGSGGAGAIGNDVVVWQAGNITTEGKRSSGVYAQSIGGGGGSGGSSFGFDTIGGSGAGGGDAGLVTVNMTGTIVTTRNDSAGIFAQSIGGGGGDGGLAAAVSLGSAIAIGGGGAKGGDAKKVTIDFRTIAVSDLTDANGSPGLGQRDGSSVTASIKTSAKRSAGIFAQSIGGGGGNGGLAGAASVGGGFSSSIAVGGTGGGGGQGAEVDLRNQADISTNGEASQGLFAQSIGGGGGNGGFAVSLAIAPGAVSLAVGGKGGDGGGGDLVTLKNYAEITTRGINSDSVFAQSVGGGGGNGGFSISGAISSVGGASIGLGGQGGGGGGGQIVDIFNNGILKTLNTDSNGITAQSIGGGGGNGGFAIAGKVSSVGGISIGAGGQGGKGGVGRKVIVQNRGAITTTESGSLGILAQSVGGGGGNGGFSISGAVSGQGAVSLGLGGFGGAGGRSNAVELSNFGDIATARADSDGLFAQSIGGGGGNGGFNISGAVGGRGAVSLGLGGFGGGGGSAGQVTVKNNANVTVDGVRSVGLKAQSVGGGGGNGGFNISGAISSGGALAVGVGGFGAGGGDSAGVDVENDGDITTSNKDSIALFAQSIGGGGGNGGFNIAGAFGSNAAAIGVGGFGAGGGQSGPVSVVNRGDLSTTSSESTALFAQSIGGGGGNGGFNISGALASSNSVAIGVGGFGGGGGVGGAVDIVNRGSLNTSAALSNGLTAQSIGGGGGNGGFSLSGTVVAGNGVAASVGGNGGSGNTSAKVSVRNTQPITTTKSESLGILAQSIGGGGGNGGFSGSFSGSTNGAAAISVGGSGGSGSRSDTVSVVNSGAINTSSYQSSAIVAQSIGGGGGNGGGVFTGTLGKKYAANLGLGGSGGTGSKAGAVSIENTEAVSTAGYKSYGLQAQSIGGGGGNGGMAIGVTLTGIPDEKQKTLTVSLGGAGGTGGKSVAKLDPQAFISPTVLVTNTSSVTTAGLDSHGIIAQSIGGGGGAGGMSSVISLSAPTDGKKKSKGVAIALGGVGGGGNTSGRVEVKNDGAISTNGDHAAGLLAQSIGGGGGVGGSSSAVVISPADSSPGQSRSVVNRSSLSKGLSADGKPPNKSPQIFNLSLGGSGGGSGNSGLVIVSNNADISTKGFDSAGIMAQSIAGGGGSGGASVDAGFIDETIEATNETVEGSGAAIVVGQLPAAARSSKDNTISVGGSGGASGNAELVRVTHNGIINTTGDQAAGIYAQSVGGGGGRGAVAGQSKGKAFLLGGSGGAAGNGEMVDVRALSGEIRTQGNNAHGIFAQSIGGGGGVAGGSTTEVKDLAATQVSTNLNGGSAGNGRDVSVVNNAEIITRGHGAYGIFAQSVGGGGGVAGSLIVGAAEAVNSSAPAGFVDACAFGCGLFHGSNGGDGKSGEISINHRGSVVTRGQSAFGIFAQTEAGSLDSLLELTIFRDRFAGQDLTNNNPAKWSATALARVGKEGVAFDITKRTTWSVDAKAAYDKAIAAGGISRPKGGFISLSKLKETIDIASAINIKVSGSVDAKGIGSHGIYASSKGGDGNGNISIDIQDGGFVSGGLRPGDETPELSRNRIAAISIQNGAVNRVDNRGTITTSNGVFGDAILGGSGDEVVSNYGEISGAVRLSSGINSFRNFESGVFNSGDRVTLGEGELVNEGQIFIGGANTILRTLVTGGFRQTNSGVTTFDIDMENRSADRLNVTGTAALAGSIRVVRQAGTKTSLGSKTVLLVDASNGLQVQDLEVFAPVSAALSYELVFTNDTRLSLRYTVDFATEGLTESEMTLGNYINNWMEDQDSTSTPEIPEGRAGALRGPVSDDPLITEMYTVLDRLMSDVPLDQLKSFYASVAPRALAQTLTELTAMSQVFNNDLLSCRSLEGNDDFLERDEVCNWGRIRGMSRDWDDGENGYSTRSSGFSGGLRIALGDNWYLGGGGSYSQMDLREDSGLQDTQGSLIQLGAIAEYQFGANTLAVSVTAGASDLDSERTIMLPVRSQAEGKQDLELYSTHIRYSRLWVLNERSYVKPILDLGVTHLRYDDFSESGSSALNLTIDSNDDTLVNGYVGVEYGREFVTQSNARIRVFADVGMNFELDGGLAPIAATLDADVAGNLPAFETFHDFDDQMGELHLGLDWLHASGAVFRVTADSWVSDNSTTYGGSFKMSVPL